MTLRIDFVHWFVVACAITTFGSGCSTRSPSPSPPPNLTDRSPFTSIPCGAPCWQGLVIGKSSESDVMVVLSKLPFIDERTIRVHRMLMSGIDPNVVTQGAEISASCMQPPTPCLTLRTADGILAGIEMDLNYEMRLDQVIQYLGNPDYIGYQTMGAENMSCEIDMVWKDKQIVLSSEKFTDSNIYQVCFAVRESRKPPSNLLISKVSYKSDESIQFLLSTGTGQFFEFSGIAPTK